MDMLEQGNNKQLLSALAGAPAADALMEQYTGLTTLAQESFEELQFVKGIGNGVQQIESLKPIELPVRMLKIEADGDPWKGLIKPKIRLMGRWLERAGFSPGRHVHVVCIAPGVIELRSPDALMLNETRQF